MVTVGCAFPCSPGLVSAVGLGAGAILDTEGNGGSFTSESVKGGSGAEAGGMLPAITPKRAPGLAAAMQGSVSLPKFKHLFPAGEWRTNIPVIRGKRLSYNTIILPSSQGEKNSN